MLEQNCKMMKKFNPLTFSLGVIFGAIFLLILFSELDKPVEADVVATPKTCVIVQYGQEHVFDCTIENGKGGIDFN